MVTILQIATNTASQKICRWHEDFDPNKSQNTSMSKFDSIAGRQLKLWRLAAKVTQSELADQIGTTASVVSLFETGGRKLSPRWLYSAAAVLKISPGTLLDRTPGEVDFDMITEFNAIPPSQRTQVIEILKTFTSAKELREIDSVQKITTLN